MRILQVLPYFPPHLGGLETVAEEFSRYFVQGENGEVINLVFSVGQPKQNGMYEKDGYKVIILPAFDIISNFPFPKFWKKSFKESIKQAKKFNPDIIQTHTRFFLSSFLGGFLAKKWKKKWVHIEHGSDYVQLAQGWKNKIAYLYDRTIGSRVFRKSDFIIPISNACKQFITSKFGRKDKMQVIYRGLEIPSNLPQVEDLHEKFPGKILVGFIGRLYKWKNVESLVQAYYDVNNTLKDKIQIIIVGNGEDMERLKNLDKEGLVYFTGGKKFEEALVYQQQFDIHYHTSNPGGGLATTLLQAMYFELPIIATPNEGALDVLIDGENAMVLESSSLKEIKRGLENVEEVMKQNVIWRERNQKIIQEKFQWEGNIKQYYILYMNIFRGKKIASLCSSLKIGGGVEKIQANLSIGLSNVGYDFYHLLSEDIIPRNEYKGKIISLHSPFIVGFGIKKMISLFSNAWKVVRICKKEKINILIGQGDYFFMVSGLAKCFGFKGKTIAVVHTTIGIWGKVINKTLRFFLSLHDKIVLISKEEQETFIQKYKFNPQKLVVIYNSIDISNIEELKKEKIDDFDFNKFTFINVGRLTYQKGQDRLLKGFDIFHQNFPDTQLVILGDGELKEEYLALKNSLTSGEDIHFLGNKENVYKYLSKSDCFVLSSHFEGFAVVLLEAMATSLPIISTDCPTGPKEIAGENSIIIMHNYNTEFLLSKAMEDIYIDESLRERLCNHKKYLKRFSPQENTRGREELLEGL